MMTTSRRSGTVRTLLLIAAVVAGAAPGARAQSGLWGVGRWDPDSFGSQRVVVTVVDTSPTGAVRADMPWRRRDATPERTRIIVTDAQDHRIVNAVALRVRRDSGSVAFQPIRGAGQYYVYYLPYTGTVRSPYPKISYLPPDSTGDPAWIAAARAHAATLPAAGETRFEAVDSMSSRWPMEVTATDAETAALRARAPAAAPFMVFVEDRLRPIKMTRAIPYLWTTRAADASPLDPAERDEYYSFQLGVWAFTALDSIDATFGDAVDGAHRIAAGAFNCVTTDGVDWQGHAFHRVVALASGDVGVLWCGIMIPRDAAPGAYHVTAVVRAASGRRVTVPLTIDVDEQLAVRHGDDDPWRLSRLRWLNSRLAADGPPIAPYTAVRGGPRDLAILGRHIVLGATGLPAQVTSTFDPAMTTAHAAARPMLAAPIALDVVGRDGTVLPWLGSGAVVTHPSTSRASIRADGHRGALDLVVRGALEFDGNLQYRIALVARRDTAVDNVRLRVPFRRDVARYFMGMNRPGGTAPAEYHWQWNVAHNQDSYWIGDINAGMQVTLTDNHYVRPLNTNFYLQSPLVMPTSWSNDGRGDCTFAAAGARYDATCSSGPRMLVAGDTLWFNVRLLITPFHVIDTRTHFATRYYHAFKPIDTVLATGATLVNVHHATDINPYLNYPFLRASAMRAYADSLHAHGIRLKIYYTVRELSDHAPELWALRSLGTDVLSGGPGGGTPWLQEHVVNNYLPGWAVPQRRDATLITSGISRWHNYYVEGMQWLAQRVGVDGIYLDDVAFDRTTMLRIRRVLVDHGTPGERVDLHSANQYDRNDGFASSANLYLEHFPFIDRLWFGEGFDYDAPPDYWLVEMSGIPFGLMGEMLQGGGNPWRGMLFGMTNRLPWTNSDPRALWHAWDDFGIINARMLGWWTPHPPVETGRDDVLATTYARPGRALIAVASWASDTAAVTLHVNWRALGIDSSRARLRAPAIAGFQPAREFTLGEPIPVAPARGWLIEVDTFDARARGR